jgi:hypothetical protein
MMARPLILVTRAVCAALLVAAAGCSSPHPASTASTDTSASRVAALHSAAQCIREHGVPTFHDPVLGANGQVFTDMRPLENAPDSAVSAARSACTSAVNAANWNIEQQPPAPAALVAAGVRAAQCLRSNGLPNYRDPTAASQYTPGHGFGVTADEMPPGASKASPVVQHAFQACRSLLDAEVQASALSNLSGK